MKMQLKGSFGCFLGSSDAFQIAQFFVENCLKGSERYGRLYIRLDDSVNAWNCSCRWLNSLKISYNFLKTVCKAYL